MNDYLNQDCDLAPDIESMLLAHVPEIFLQQHRHLSAVLTALGNVRSWGKSGKHLLVASFSHFDPKRT